MPQEINASIFMTQATQPVVTTDNNAARIREATSDVERARTEKDQAAQETRQARLEEQKANKRLQQAEKEERRATEKVREARSESQQARQTDTSSTRGGQVNLVV